MYWYQVVLLAWESPRSVAEKLLFNFLLFSTDWCFMHIESLPLCFPLRLLVGKCKPQKHGHVVALKHVGIPLTFFLVKCCCVHWVMSTSLACWMHVYAKFTRIWRKLVDKLEQLCNILRCNDCRRPIGASECCVNRTMRTWQNCTHESATPLICRLNHRL